MTKARNIPVKYGLGKPSSETKNRRRHGPHTSKKGHKSCLVPITIVNVEYVWEYEITSNNEITPIHTHHVWDYDGLDEHARKNYDEHVEDYLDEMYWRDC